MRVGALVQVRVGLVIRDNGELTAFEIAPPLSKSEHHGQHFPVRCRVQRLGGRQLLGIICTGPAFLHQHSPYSEVTGVRDHLKVFGKVGHSQDGRSAKKGPDVIECCLTLGCPGRSKLMLDLLSFVLRQSICRCGPACPNL